MEYTLSKLRLAVHNESGWNFLRGVCDHSPAGLLVQPAIKQLAAKERGGASASAYALGVLLDVLVAEAAAGTADALAEASAVCDQLAREIDPIRAKYWLHRKAALGV